MKKLLLIFLFSSLLLVFHFESLQDELSGELLRLHIVANSDSETDQNAKLLVRDALIKHSKENFSDFENKEDFKLTLKNDLYNQEQIANKVLENLNLPYKATSSIENIYIPKKIYNGIILPKGRYDSLVLRLGEAKGKNWWCVLYPPLCFTESVSGEISPEGLEYLKSTLSKESYDLITSDNIEIEYKFKLLEIFNSIKEHIKKGL